jgi:rod shape-determining protein MreD
VKFVLKMFLLAWLVQLAGAGILPEFLPRTLTPNLVLPFVIYTGFHSGMVAGSVVSFLLGNLADIFTGVVPGMNGLLCLVTFSLSHAIRKRFFLQSPVFQFAAILLLVVVNDLTLVLVFRMIPAVNFIPLDFTGWMIPEALVSSIAGIAIFSALGAMDDRRWSRAGGRLVVD